jgi:YVTN family beta-propeller protein
MTPLLVVLPLLITTYPADAPARPREPTAIVIAPGGTRAFVANRGTGSIALIDAETRQVLTEVAVGGTLSDLAGTADGSFLYATDEARHRLAILTVTDQGPVVRARLDVAPYPVQVRASADGRRVYVASLWSRRLTCLDLDDEGTNPKSSRVVDLPFAPRCLLVLEGAGKLVVADAFGGFLGVVDVASWSLDSVRTLKAHNIGGMALHPDGKRLVMVHQDLNRAARSTSDDIHWGFLVASSLRWLRVDDILTPTVDPADGGRVTSLGRPGDGGGDPGGLAFTADGTAVITLSGTGRVVIGPIDEPVSLRVLVGRRPTAVALAPDGKRAFVANTYDDSISIVDLPDAKTVATVSLGPQATLTEVDRGARLFHDARLSQEGWMSCQSCHSSGHTNNLVADTLGDETYGAPKRVPSLLGVVASAPYAWKGQIPDLETQVRKSVQTTMRGRPLRDEEMNALVAFMKSLTPPPSADRLMGRIDPVQEARGEALFERRCERCHSGPARTDGRNHDVGHADEDGHTHFNTPSLLGVAQRDRLLHDGRCRSLHELLAKGRHPNDDSPLSEAEIADLIVFLKGL